MEIATAIAIVLIAVVAVAVTRKLGGAASRPEVNDGLVPQEPSAQFTLDPAEADQLVDLYAEVLETRSHESPSLPESYLPGAKEEILQALVEKAAAAKLSGGISDEALGFFRAGAVALANFVGDEESKESRNVWDLIRAARSENASSEDLLAAATALAASEELTSDGTTTQMLQMREEFNRRYAALTGG